MPVTWMAGVNFSAACKEGERGLPQDATLADEGHRKYIAA